MITSFEFYHVVKDGPRLLTTVENVGIEIWSFFFNVLLIFAKPSVKYRTFRVRPIFFVLYSNYYYYL